MIIGVTGTKGAGKDTAVSFLESQGFSHFSVRNFLTKELNKRGMPVNRPTLSSLGDDLRKNMGQGLL